jgi:hypothetical protein
MYETAVTKDMDEILKSINEIRCSENQEHILDHEYSNIAQCYDCHQSKTVSKKCTCNDCQFAICQDCLDIRIHTYAKNHGEKIFKKNYSNYNLLSRISFILFYVYKSI